MFALSLPNADKVGPRMSPQERERRRQQSERDQEAEQLRRDQGLHDEARLSPKMAARLPTGAVAARYGVTTRSVDRWWKNPDLNFPQPIIVNQRKYWALTDLEIWERQRVAEKVGSERTRRPQKAETVSMEV